MGLFRVEFTDRDGVTSEVDLFQLSAKDLAVWVVQQAGMSYDQIRQYLAKKFYPGVGWIRFSVPQPSVGLGDRWH